MYQYPRFAEIDGEKFPINTDYKVALRCFKVINDREIGDGERALAVIYLLFGFIPEKNHEKFLEKAEKFLTCGKPQNEDSERDIDLNVDKGFVIASFMSDYKIDLSSTDMHFWQFIDLITGLSKDCVLNRVRDIRNYDLSEISNPDERRKMAKAQAELALPETFTAEELAAIDEFDRLFIDDYDE